MLEKSAKKFLTLLPSKSWDLVLPRAVEELL